MCRRFGSLPNAGGIMDQDHLLLRKVSLVLDAFVERDNVQAEKAKAANERNKGKGKR